MMSSARLRRALFGITAVAVIVGTTGLRAEDGPDASRAGGATTKTIHVQPRYYRWYVDAGEKWVESNTGYARLNWNIPREQVALVLVDIWDRHYIEDPENRAETIIQQNIRPLLQASRHAGIEIIHAPSPREARLYKAWMRPSHTKEAPAQTAAAARAADSPWPPREFRRKTGPYEKYARPFEPMASVRAQRLKGMRIHPDVEPVGSEVVVASGEELHQYCKEKGILFLVYLGFNTNACILTRDYGTLAMGKRGYEIILLRDCTTGMESCETTDKLLQTRGAIQFLEMFGKYSITSQEFIAGLPDRPGK